MNSPGVPPGTRTMTSSCASLCLLLVSACYLDNPGVDPPAGVLSFPVAMSYRDPSASSDDVLYVVNSNFSLRYNAGSVQAYDLAKLAKAIDKDECRGVGVTRADELQQSPDGGTDDAGPLDEDGGLDGGGMGDASVDDAGGPLGGDVPLRPGYEEGADFRGAIGVQCKQGDEGNPCCFNSDDFLLGGKGKSEILIDSFASGLAVAPDGRRLYVPVRSRDRLMYIDIDDAGQLSCGDDKGRCTRGTVPSDVDQDPLSKLQPQPTALSVGRLDTLVAGEAKGTFIATAHENGGVGFFVDDGKGPVLHDTQFTDGRLTSITADPRSGVFYLTTSQRVSRVSRFGLRELDDRYALIQSPAVRLEGVLNSFDTRDVLLDEDDPNRLIVLMRGVVQSLLFVRLDPTDVTGAKLEGQLRLDIGPSRLAQATIDGRRVLFVSCYDARVIYVVDVETRALVRVIRGLQGPFEMLADEARSVLYVADFSVSVVRVVDLSGLFDVTLPPPRIIATLGKVRVPEGLK